MASAQSVTTGDDEDNTTNYRVRSFSIAFPKDGENGVDDRRKKRNKKEKDRSNKICELISALRSTLEEGGVSVPRATKQVILQQAINHIRQLEDFKTRAHLLVSKSTKHAALTPSVPATSSSRPTVSMVGAGLERERALLDAVLRQKTKHTPDLATKAIRTSLVSQMPSIAPSTMASYARREQQQRSLQQAIPCKKTLTASASLNALSSMLLPTKPRACQNQGHQTSVEASANLRGQLLSATPAFLQVTKITANELTVSNIFRFVKLNEIEIAHTQLCALLKQEREEIRMESEITNHDLIIRTVSGPMGEPLKFLVTFRERY